MRILEQPLLNDKNVLIFAGNHPISDPRIVRTVEVLSKLGNVEIYHGRTDFNVKFYKENKAFCDSRRIHLIPLDMLHVSRLKIPKYRKWVKLLTEEIGMADLIYIHDPGITGILLSAYIKKKFNKKVIFDYHDSIAFEHYYQFNKIGIRSKSLCNIYTYIVTGMLKKIDAIVGISELQIKQILSYRKTLKPFLVVPNIRPTLSLDYLPKNDCLEFVWIGYVMKGKGLYNVISFLNGFHDRKFKLSIIGKIEEVDFKQRIQEKAKYNIIFHGGYASDYDIMKMLDGIAIGVICPEKDPLNSKVEEISSPNKAYSMINVGIPLIIDEGYLSLSKIIGKYNAGEVFSQEKENEAYETINKIYDNYEEYKNNILKLKADMNEEKLKKEMYTFYKTVMDCSCKTCKADMSSERGWRADKEI